MVYESSFTNIREGAGNYQYVGPTETDVPVVIKELIDGATDVDTELFSAEATVMMKVR